MRPSLAHACLLTGARIHSQLRTFPEHYQNNCSHGTQFSYTWYNLLLGDWRARSSVHGPWALRGWWRGRCVHEHDPGCAHGAHWALSWPQQTGSSVERRLHVISRDRGCLSHEKVLYLIIQCTIYVYIYTSPLHPLRYIYTRT